MASINDDQREKRRIRRSMVKEVLRLDTAEREGMESVLRARFPLLDGYASASSVLLYVRAFVEEIDTRPMLERAQREGKRLVCPRVDRQVDRLRLFEIRSIEADLVPGTLNIPEPRPGLAEVEPDEIDWVLVPGLAFDQDCYRLGRGAGYYDRLLPRLRTDAPRWALAFDCQVVPKLPVEPHDVPVDGVVTPDRLIVRGEVRGPSLGDQLDPGRP